MQNQTKHELCSTANTVINDLYVLQDIDLRNANKKQKRPNKQTKKNTLDWVLSYLK